jgi:hypothetical protein
MESIASSFDRLKGDTVATIDLSSG